jgi:hypothetical protein
MMPRSVVIPSSEPLSSYLAPVAANSMVGGASKYSAITRSGPGFLHRALSGFLPDSGHDLCPRIRMRP